MKTLRCLLVLICIFAISAASIAEDKGVYRVPVEARDLLVGMKAAVRHGQIDGYYIAELSPFEVDNLVQHGFAVELLFESAEAENRALRQIDGTDEFHTYDQIRDEFTPWPLPILT